MMKKRILLIGPIDISRDDAPKVHFSNLARAFRFQGANVRCILYKPERSKYELIGNDIKVSFIPNPLLGNVIKRLFKYIYSIPVILWEFLKFKPEMVYFRFSPPVFIYLFILKGLKTLPFPYKMVIEFNDWVSEQRAIQGENKLKVSFIKFLQISTAMLADYIRVVSEGIKKKLLLYGAGENKIVVIGNGTDINHFKPTDKIEAKKGIGLNSEYLYVGFIGNFAIWQGLDYLIQAIPSVLKAKNNIRFILVGDGPELSKIQKKVSQFKNKEVLLTGRVSYKEAVRYINAFDVGIAPFTQERNASIGLSPLKIRDYAACGVPIITSRIAGLEIVEEEDIGILVPPDDSVALSRAIIELLKKTEMRKEMGKKGRKIAEKHYSWNGIVNQILEFIFR